MSLHHELITPNLRTTSRLVAEKFGKRHDNILRDIAKTVPELPAEFGLLNFEETSYIDSHGRAQRQYELTRDGFTLITMGFTGREAMAWKIRYIEAFNAMEAELRAPEPGAADLPEGEELTHRDWLAMVREARLLGGVTAGRRMWDRSPLPPLIPIGQIRACTSPEDGMSCLAHLLAALGEEIAEARLIGEESVTLAAQGVRTYPEALFVANFELPAFRGTRWQGGLHRPALLALPNVHPVPGTRTLAGVRTRGLVLPWRLIDGEDAA